MHIRNAAAEPQDAPASGWARERGLALMVALALVSGSGPARAGSPSASVRSPGKPAPSAALPRPERPTHAAADPNEAALGTVRLPPPALVRLAWGQLERHDGAYDFQVLEEQLQRCVAAGRQASLLLYAIDTTHPASVPLDLASTGLGGVSVAAGSPHAPFRSYVPDLNDPKVLHRVDGLLRALAQRYDGDPRLAHVVIGLVGEGGLWDEQSIAWPQGPNLLAHADPSVPAATRCTWSTQRAVIELYSQHLRQTPLLMPLGAPGAERATRYALRAVDGRGALLMSPDAQLDPETGALLSTRWKSAPLLGLATSRWTAARTQALHLTSLLEPLSPHTSAAASLPGPTCGLEARLGRVSTQATWRRDGLYRIDAWWTNRGTAPATTPLRVGWSLRATPGGPPVWEGVSRLDGTSLLPSATARRVRDSGRLPARLPAGRYLLCVTAQDTALWRTLLPLTVVGKVRVAPGPQSRR